MVVGGEGKDSWEVNSEGGMMLGKCMRGDDGRKVKSEGWYVEREG